MDEVNTTCTVAADDSLATASASVPWSPRKFVFRPYELGFRSAVKTQNLGGFVKRPLVSRLTKDLVDTYRICNPQFNYSDELIPKRYLTSPSAGVLNDGHDNENSDLILAVNCGLVNLDSHRRYIVKDILGQGTFGQVAKCWVSELNRFVAVKIIKNQPAYYQQALVEVSILTTLNKKFDPEDKHHIVRIYDYFVYQRHLCIAFELLDSNLYELIKLNQFRGLSLSIVQLFSKQILYGLALMKDAAIIHCDLKPENILLCTSVKPAKIKIIDFGSACMEDHTVYSYIQSRYYRSPEVLLGYQYTTAIDMWSFGCIVAELFLGLPLFPGASEFDLLRRMIKILGEQPPDYVLKEAKNTNKFFKCVGSVNHEESSQVSSSGKSIYQALNEEEYEARELKKPSIGKEYFNHMNLEAIVKKYPYKKNLHDEDLAKESQIRLALIDFLRGLVEFDPAKRWSPLQASKHPFVTGEPFTCPYTPAPETPRVPVSHNVKVDHHPAGGHWFAAGLSPNVLGGNRVAMYNNSHFQVMPYAHGGNFGNLGSHGSYNDGIGLGSSYGSYGDNSNVLTFYSPVGPSNYAQGSGPTLGSSPDARRRIMQIPHGNGYGFSPFAPMSLGTSPSQFTPPYSQVTTVSPGHYGPSSPARGNSHGSPLGKGTVPVNQMNRRKGWGYSDVNTSSGQADTSSPVLGSSMHHLQPNLNAGNWKQQQWNSGNVSGHGSFGSKPFPHAKGGVHDKPETSSSLPDPGDWDPNYRHEVKVIEEVVPQISVKLGSINEYINKKLVGMEARVEKVLSSLETGIDDFRMIGIWGIGGGGKTTLARAVFNQISMEFEGKSFVENVRERSQKAAGLESLQKQILSEVLDDQSIEVSGVRNGKIWMKNVLRGRKVLIVLDDVDHIEQLEAVAESDWFEPGSRVIITTRDKHVLIAHGVKQIHNVDLLSGEEALCLFSRYAFGKDIPTQGYEKLSRELVRYAAGVPLLIKVLGTLLCDKDLNEWMDQLQRPKKETLQNPMDILKLSYYSLEEELKEMFLDIACFLKSRHKDDVVRILESCGFYALEGLRFLEGKSLITTTDGGYLGMHDLIQEMGRYIVRHLHRNDPQKHSHLWILQEIEHILADDLGTEATRAIVVESPVKLCSEVVTKGFGSMKNLRLLRVVSEIDDDCDEKIGQTSQNFPDALQFLSWEGYPHWSLPKTFEAKNLVALEMPYSRIIQLWEGEGKILYKLKFLNLKHSQLRNLDLGLTPNLESLDLEDCIHLVELHMPSIGCLPSLVYANLSGCSKIEKSIPRKETLEELESRYKSLPIGTFKDVFLDIACLLKGLLKEDVIRILGTCYYQVGRDLEVLEEADLIFIDDHQYVVMHPHIEALGKYIVRRDHPDEAYKHSRLWICEEIEYILANDLGTEATRAIVVDRPVKLSSQAVTKGFGSMKNLKLLSVVSDIDDNCDEKIGQISPNFPNELRFLSWVGYPHGSLPKTFEAYNLVALEMPCSRITQLWEAGERKTFDNLKFLNLRHTQLRTLDLGLTPNLERLELEGCNDLVELLHTPITHLKRLVYLNLSGCLRIKYFEFIKELGSLEILSLSRLYLKEFPDIIPGYCDSRLLELQFRYNDIEEVPSSIENLQKLVCLDFHSCRKLRRLPDSICALQHLRNLKLYGCSLEKLPEDIGRLGCLEKLNLSFARIKHLPTSICNLKQLKTLNLSFCHNLEKLPGDICRLACLKKLILKKCTQVRDIPDSICQLKSLEYLSLLDCVEVEKLPRKLGDVGSLKVLNVKGTNIRRLPLSISNLVDLEIHAPKKNQSCFD